jgi:hypothetical protein
MYHRRIISLLILVFFLISIPFLAAWLSQGDDYVFSGFLANPFDGNSYLAKMMEGYQGEWTFKLPYSLTPGEGSYIFLFYILLGHIARVSRLDPIVVFHISRLLAFIFLYFVLFRFITKFFKGDRDKIWPALIVTVLGSGMGWLAVLFGYKSSDLWVAEAFPFLSSYQNPHFPLGLGLMLLILILFYTSNRGFALLGIFFSGLLLAIILPFGAVVVGLVIFLEQTWSFLGKENVFPVKVFLLILGTLPLVLYQFYLVNTHLELGIWNAQNQTPSPPLWDFILSFLPALLLAIISAVTKFKGIRSGLFKVTIVWLILGLVIIYLPLGIQRRFMVGYYIPISILASAFILTFESKKIRTAGFAALLASSLLTISIILLAGVTGFSTKNPLLVLTKPESDGLDWIKNNTRVGQGILADSRMGMFIPARTSLRVIYGHPFETINAVSNKSIVDKFFACEYTPDEAEELIRKIPINYILLNSRDPKLCYPGLFNRLELVFRTGHNDRTVEIYGIK